jgi:3-oxoacyl-[acyl-carrier protein] reductase
VELGLAGRVALVTGGRRGIGAAVARTLAVEGADVAVLDLVDDDALAAVLEDVAGAGVRAMGIEGDAADFAAADAAVRAVVRRWGRLDVLVTCAGIARDAVSWKMKESEWDEVLRVNLTGTFACARSAGAHMRRSGEGGRIVAVSSINGLRGKVGQANYAASKAGVHGLVRTLAREFGPAGITVNAVAPGMVRTAMTAGLPRAVVERAERETVSGRLADVDDVARAVVFLASWSAGSITGQVLCVDSGQSI